MVKPKSSTQLRHLESVLKALANRRRLLMLATVRRQREMYVSALAEELRLPFKTVSRNLRLLERARLVVSDPRGVYVYYRLNPNAPSPAGPVINYYCKADEEGLKSIWIVLNEVGQL